MPRAAENASALDIYPQQSLAGGLNVAVPATQIADNETPECLNVDFDSDAIATSQGMRKFGNQVAPGCALRFRHDPALAPLYIGANKSVPLIGHVPIPYSEDYDIGGAFDFEGTFPSSDTFHNRRGKSFEINVSYRLPVEERLFAQDTLGTSAPAVPDPVLNPFHGFDEALDECHLIVQKGGDRTAPMSWALGIVNIGKQASGDASGITAPASRASNYCPVFMWFDAAEAGELVCAAMRYTLASGAAPSAGAFSTRALRAVIVHEFIEPGSTYSFAFQVKLDTGTQGGAAANTAWNHDGFVKCWVSKNGEPARLVGAFVDSSGGGSLSGMDVYKGPDDSARYLSKYGIRYAGRDAIFWGMGVLRSHPWQTAGFLPWGADAAPLENGGWRMIDRSATTVASLYGGGIHTLTCFKNANADTFLRVNHGGLSNGNTNGGIDPMATFGAAYVPWAGLGAGATPNFNAQALKKYRAVTTNDFNLGAPNSKGAIFSIENYVQNGANNEMGILGGASINAFGAVGNQRPILIQCFRWNPRQFDSGVLRFWKTPRAYDDTDVILAHRRRMSIHRTIDISDVTEPDRENLIAQWNGDDGGGQVVRESVVGGPRNGFLAPFGLGISDGGTRGKNQLFLSGEGEALCLDLSENPVAKRELEAMLRGDAQGFAVEFTGVFPQALYAIMSPTSSETLPDSGSALNGNRPRFVPDIISWDVKEPSASGLSSTPKPILSLTFRGLRSDPAATASFTRPAGFSAEFAVKSDQENVGPIVHSDLLPWYLSGGVNVSRYSLSADWVGKPITMIVGLQPVPGSPDTYTAFIAMHPKQDFQPGTTDPGDAEFAYKTTGGTTYDFSGTYYQAATIRIAKKDIARSVIVIGGRWNPAGLGYAELNCPLILDEVRIHGAAAPGALPTSNGGIVLTRDGKLEGLKCLPPRELTREEIKQPLGRSLRAVDVTQASRTVTPTNAGRFFTDAPQDTRNSVVAGYLLPEGDVFDVPRPETPGFEQNEFYRINAVASDGSSATLNTAANIATRRGAGASVFRLLGYTSFADAVVKRALPLASARAYNPSTSTTRDVLLSEPLFENLAPISVDFRVRIYGPGARDVLPLWTRGLVSPRRSSAKDGILGIASVGDAIYAGVRGALYQADDRWRHDGPSDTIRNALAFRAQTLSEAADLSIPLQDDRLEFATFQGLAYQPDPAHAYCVRYDAWIRPHSMSAYQTLLWVGDPTTDPQKIAGTHRVHMIQRLNRGRPEIVFGSTASTTGGVPEKGLFIATAAATLADLEHSHVRWLLVTRSQGGVSVLLKPYCFVNGRLVKVIVNGVENNAAITQTTDWLRTSTIAQPGILGVAVFGASRDAYKAPVASVSLTAQGPQLRAQHIQGWLHALGADLSEFVATTAAPISGTPSNFDPFALTYSDAVDTTFNMLGAQGEGVGHHVLDHATMTYGVIRSHPFVSVFHELGTSDEPISFALFGQELYAVNGERVARVSGLRGVHAGVLPPTAELSMELKRFPLWVPNVRAVPGTAGVFPDQDPVPAALAGAAQQINHYSTPGNNYLKHPLTGADATAMAWVQGGYFHFKRYWRPRSIAGRINIWRKGQSKEAGGPFVECRDGVLYVGWYDTYLKREVSAPCSGPVFRAGELHYINVRVRWPEGDAVEGNWTNSFYSDGRIRRTTFSAATGTFQVGETITAPAGRIGIVVKQYGAASLVGIEYLLVAGANPVVGNVWTGATSAATGTSTASTIRPMHNVAIVRRFPRAALTNLKDDALDALVVAGAPADNETRNLISFTTSNGPTGCTATGCVTFPGCTFTGGAGGQVDAGNTPSGTAWGAAAVGARLFHRDMVGMYFQFASGAFIGQVFRITQWLSGFSIVVRALDGSIPNLTGSTNLLGGVFAGIAIVKGDQFDSSRTPDAGTYDIEVSGTSLQSSPINGFAPHDAEVWTEAWAVTANTSGENAQCFETRDSSAAGANVNDPIMIGTDYFRAHNYDSSQTAASGDNAPGALRVDDTRAFYCADCQVYTGAGWTTNISTQPNAALEVVKDPHAANTAPTCTAADPGAGRPVWQKVQSAANWAATRYFAVAFFDLEQGIPSNPGPVLRVTPAGEDAMNPSGAVRALLKQLPAARDLGTFEVHVYASAANGDAANLFRVLTLPNLTAEAAVQEIEEVIGDGLPLEFDNGEPPECRIIALSNERLFAAALTALSQLDALIPSKEEAPGQFVYDAAKRLNTGAGDAITGLAELDGLLLAMKREGVFSITLNADGTLAAKIITNGAGCVAHQSVVEIDKRAIWRGDRGLYHAARGGSASDLAQVAWLSEKLESLFRTDFDALYASRSSAAVNRLRDQYVLTAKALSSPYVNERLSAMGDVFSRYRHPNITALATVRDPGGGATQLVGGTQDGFLVWMDRNDTQLLLMGPLEQDSGSSSILVANTGSTSTAILVGSGFVDSDLEGMRGTVVRWRVGDVNGVGGTDYEAVILGTEGGILHLDRPVAVLPVGASVATIGAQVHEWWSKQFAFQQFQAQKRLSFLDIELEEGSAGLLRVEFFLNRNSVTRAATKLALPTTGKFLELGPLALHGKHVQVRISSEPLTTGGKWKVTGLVWRFQAANPTP